MDLYFYKEVFTKKGQCGNGEWLPSLVKNHICALESMKRVLTMVETSMVGENKFKFIMFIRPDVMFINDLNYMVIMDNPHTICIPNFDHNEGFNDRFAIMNLKNALLYGKRIDELAIFRKYNGSIVSETYLKYIINKYKIDVTLFDIKFNIIRP